MHGVSLYQDWCYVATVYFNLTAERYSELYLCIHTHVYAFMCG